MKSVRLEDGITTFFCRDIPEPVLIAGAVKVQIEAAFLPPFFQHLPGGGWATPPRPFTPGQCAIGRAVQVGEGVRSIQTGQRVYCDMYVESPGALANTSYGFAGCFGVGPETAPLLVDNPDGTFREVAVFPEHALTTIPENVTLSSDVLCRIGWFATALSGFERAGFQPGDRVAINGAAGMLGSSAALLAMAMGASKVHLVGRRADVLGELVALSDVMTVDSAKADTEVDLVLDCTGGDDAAPTLHLFSRLKRGGVLSIVGALTVPLSVDTSRLMRMSQQIVGTFWFPKGAVPRVLDLIESGALDLSRLRADRFLFEDVNAAMDHSVASSGGFDHVCLVPSMKGNPL